LTYRWDRDKTEKGDGDRNRKGMYMVQCGGDGTDKKGNPEVVWEAMDVQYTVCSTNLVGVYFTCTLYSGAISKFAAPFCKIGGFSRWQLKRETSHKKGEVLQNEGERIVKCCKQMSQNITC
jgi:hypothetical protein